MIINRLLLLSVALFSITIATQDAVKQAVQKTIVAFFEGFHSKDSVAMKKTISSEVFLIGKTRQHVED